MLTELKGKQPNLSLQGLIISGNYLRETQFQHPWASNEDERIKINTISLEMHLMLPGPKYQYQYQVFDGLMSEENEKS